MREPPQDSVWAAAKKAERSLKEGRSIVLPLMAHYPASRNWRDVSLEPTQTFAPGSPTEGYARCLSHATDVRQLKLCLKTRQWFVVKEQRAAPDLEAVPAAVLKCLGNVEIAGEQSLLLASLP